VVSPETASRAAVWSRRRPAVGRVCGRRRLERFVAECIFTDEPVRQEADAHVSHDGHVRFEVSQALDAIEERLATDPLRTGGVLDVSEAMRLSDLTVGRPATLLRLGLLVDALTRLLGDGEVALYAVAERGLLSDTELPSNERMVLRRWSDDGLVEILPAGAPALSRAVEISALTGQPVITRVPVNGYALRPLPESGGAALVQTGSAAAPVPHPALQRAWRCPRMGCASFGAGRLPAAQPPPLLATGAPTCPRHDEPLTDLGPRPPAVAMVVRVDGLVRQRFVASATAPVIVGRAPEDHNGLNVADLLDERAAGWISRRHLTVEMRADGPYVTDTSTNGTVLVPSSGERVRLVSGQPYRLGEQDAVELSDGIQIARAGALSAAKAAGAPGSVMADAPTVAIEMPRSL
jgi:hypothetical protein